MSSSPSTPPSTPIALDLTPDQLAWIANAARFLSTETSSAVPMRSVIMRLMEYGLPLFEQELADLRADRNLGRKRFPKLQLVLTK